MPINCPDKIVADTETNNGLKPEGFKNKSRYKCICSPDCNYEAGKLKKLINHILTVHHPDKTEEWVITNFWSLFVKQKNIAPVKKKKLSRPIERIKSYGYSQSYGPSLPPYMYGETGYILGGRVNRDFDYDLDGRVK